MKTYDQMRHNLAILKTLREHGYTKYASFLVYNFTKEIAKACVNDETIHADAAAMPDFTTDRQWAEVMLPEVMFLGLNVADRDVYNQTTAELTNAHDTRGETNDTALMRMLYNSGFEGAYFTDLFKGLPETKSASVAKKLKDNPDIKQRSINIINDEIEIIKPKMIVVLGNPTKQQFDRLVKNGDITLPLNCDVVYVKHYSDMVSNMEKRARLFAPEVQDIRYKHFGELSNYLHPLV